MYFETNLALKYWMLLGVISFAINLFITAPYGRHSNTKWGKLIDNKLGWFLMELPALLVFPSLAYLQISQTDSKGFVIFFIFIWLVHYINRTIIFPIRIPNREKKMPVAVCVMAFLFNVINGGFLGYGIKDTLHLYTASWLSDPRFIIGCILCFTGIFINWSADARLIKLGKNITGNEKSAYTIPRGWLFERISCPNHFGEIVEWLGFAFMTWNLAGFSFALWAFGNLVPRALSHHKWYKKEFRDYPKSRKAVIPYIL